ncbi:unnamed protein product [Oppiella nova]|uniref:Uncharacterized protein n=1 Tax=Oppiella nova TaxID=334625 RepID=A0A7R9QS17_9ACAR|nr:unnamed protein product [Oppiella nova]CAG2171822.1 unnamed protein product [Oppiella nova]
MISSLVLMSISIITIPYSQYIPQLYTCFWLFGFGSGVYVNVKYVWLIDMWQESSAPILHLAGFMFGIGHTLGPLIEKPYLTGEQFAALDADNRVALVAKNISVHKSDILSDDSYVRRHKLMIPYLICGSIHILGPILLAIIFNSRRTSTLDSTKLKIVQNNDNTTNIHNNNNNTKNNNTTTTNGSKKLLEQMPQQKLTMIILVCLLLAFFSASESIFFAFSATYFQYIPLKLSASSAAQLVSSMALTFTISRGVAIILAMRTTPQKIIAVFLAILLVSMVLLFFATNSLTLLWLAILLMSFGFSPIYASIFSFMGRYLEFTNQLGTVLLLSANSLNLVLPGLLGAYIEVMPNIFLVTLISCATFTY